MRGVDTNILVRFLTGDDAAQTERVDQLLESADRTGERLRIDGIVLCELVWVLRSAYDASRAEIGELLARLIRSRQFLVDDRDSVNAALTAYRTGRGDFSDYLIGERNHRAGCRSTTTFDRALTDSPRFEVL